MSSYFHYERSSKVNLSVQYYINSVFRKIEFPILLLLCIACIIFSKNHKDFSIKTSSFFINISLPIVKIVEFPFSVTQNIGGYFAELVSAKKENAVLKAENERLKSVYIQVLNISQENRELKDLLKFINLRSTRYRTVHLITKPNQPYSSNIIIDAGKNQGIQENSIITGKRSVIGRVVFVGEDKSRVLTISDENSRIPVITSTARARGILTGHNNNVMTIEYLDKDHHIKAGEMVFTSGDDDYLAPGLLIGIVTKAEGTEVHVKAIENADNTNLAVISQY